jgi:hypothetical protein
MARQTGGYSVAKCKQMPGRDGYVLSGELHRDGARVAHYFDDGNGGEMRIDFLDRAGEEERRFTDFVASLPPEPPDPSIGIAEPMDVNAAMFVCGLVDIADRIRRYRRLCKTKTVFRGKDDPNDTYRTLTALPNTEGVREYLAKNWPGATVINDVLERGEIP